MQKKTILVVDDSSTIRKIMEKELVGAGFEVITAKDGMEALAVLEWSDKLPDLITLDIDMPGMNGFQVVEYLQTGAASGDMTKKRISAIPVIFVSAGDTTKNRQHGYELGVVDFISKPFPRGRVVETIQTIFEADLQFEGMSVLVVDDSPVVRRIIHNILSRHGLTIHEAEDGEKAVPILKERKNELDLIITDYMMPGLSGTELCETARSMEELQHVPIIFVSSLTKREAVLGFFRVGANDYLEKPFLEEEFRARILPQLNNRRFVKELDRLNKKLKFAAEHDVLTTLYNRGYFLEEGVAIFSRHQLAGMQLSAIGIDLDHFKRINDSRGHAFGDVVLRDFAALMQECCNHGELPARVGGEEFLILLPGSDSGEAQQLAEKIRTRCEAHIYTDGNSELHVTASLGVVSLQEHNPVDFDRFLIMADEALYSAKEQGRNRVQLWQSGGLKALQAR